MDRCTVLDLIKTQTVSDPTAFYGILRVLSDGIEVIAALSLQGDNI